MLRNQSLPVSIRSPAYHTGEPTLLMRERLDEGICTPTLLRAVASRSLIAAREPRRTRFARIVGLPQRDNLEGLAAIHRLLEELPPTLFLPGTKGNR